MSNLERNALLQIYPSDTNSLNSFRSRSDVKSITEDSLSIRGQEWTINLEGSTELTGTAYGSRVLFELDQFTELLNSFGWDYHIEVFEDSGRLVKRYLK